MKQVLFCLLLTFLFVEQPIECSYQYLGCYAHVFYNTYYSSSYMEPTLCFRLCDTPVIYLQRTVCRCAGPGLTHGSRRTRDFCTIPCPQPVDRSVSTYNTCGGTSAYSVYVQRSFYSLHGHLFNYQIEFNACELWKNSVYETYKAQYNLTIRLSLNRLERCAAACLDQNATTTSIGFNGDKSECLCILPLKPSRIFDRINNVLTMSNGSCDLLCSDVHGDLTNLSNFRCGSKSNNKIVAIYSLNGSCPVEFTYISEINKCIYTYKNFWNSCSSPSKIYTYSGEVPWDVFLKIIDRLNLKESIVTVDFGDDFVINDAWKCSSNNSNSFAASSSNTWRYYSSSSNSNSFGWRSSTRYILDRGCLRESSYSSYSHRYSYRICASNPLNRDLPIDNDDDDDKTYVTSVNPTVDFCPPTWFDLNGRCYRMSDERKTIQDARKSCITVPEKDETKNLSQAQIWRVDSKGNFIKSEEIENTPSGRLVEFSTEWQARLGFFLLHTVPDSKTSIETDPESLTTTIRSIFYEDADSSLDANVSSDANTTTTPIVELINEFHLSEQTVSENETENQDSCVLATRSTAALTEKPYIITVTLNNCTEAKHVMCETNTLVVKNFHAMCLRKPISLGLPSIISNLLTHELCLSVCQELQTKLAVLHKNKCYCLNGANPNSLNITIAYEKYRVSTCGEPCPGNKNEMCGNADTIVALQILESRRTFTLFRTPAEAYPDFSFDSCIRLNSFNQSSTYQFTTKDRDNFHPRHCLALCQKFDQKYALINNGECLCTNSRLKEEYRDVDILTGQNCSQTCAANYFYSCGSSQYPTIYSMYIMKPRCRHGFDVAENDQQCVYAHFSNKKSSIESAREFCRSIGGHLARIKDIVEIQDILPDSILHTRLMQQLLLIYNFHFMNDTRYYWIDRTDEESDENMISERLLKTCPIQPDIIDRNCISITSMKRSQEKRIDSDRCIASSDECSSESAMPVCVDQHLENKVTNVPPITEDESRKAINLLSVDYSCSEKDEKSEYHLIDEYCYRFINDESTWNDAKAKCQQDGAILFVPEKSVTLQHIKAFYLRHHSYSASGFVHVGVFYNQMNNTVTQYDIKNNEIFSTVPDSNAVYDLCERSFQSRYAIVMLSSSLSGADKSRLQSQQIGCGYIDIYTSNVPTIRCDEIPCSRTAAIICQKPPIVITKNVEAYRQWIDVPSLNDLTTTSPIKTEPINSGKVSTTTLPIETQTVSTNQTDSIAPTVSGLDQKDQPQSSISRNLTPLFFLLVIVGLFFALVGVNVIFKKNLIRYRPKIFRRKSERPVNSLYSQLTSNNDLDLN